MSGMENGMETVTLRVNRFTPRPERGRERGGSPFARKSSPFGDSGSTRRRPRGKQWVQDYVVPARPEDTVLDCLLKVKRTIDPTLAFRYSCGHGMCGSDAMSINGTPTLLCTATVKAWAKQPSDAQVDEDGFRHTGEDVQPAQTQDADDLGVIELAPLPGFPVQRDLIADIDQMLDQIRKLKPYLQASGELATTADGKINAFEYLQNPQQLAKYELLSNCIACGTCAQICPDEVFRLERKKGEIPTIMYPDECWHCNACVLDCPKQAIELRFPLHYMVLKTAASTLNQKTGA